MSDRESLIADRLGALWCDDFDADLPKVVPGALEALGVMADVEMRTYCYPTNGRINCPAAWHTNLGLTAYFSTPDFGQPQPFGYVTAKQDLVPCTFWEVVRDEWIHDAVVVVNRQWVWSPPVKLMMDLMYDLRGWTALDDLSRAAIRRHVLDSLAAAADRLRAVVA
ncbi:MAG TPA: hypothetical protein VLE97_10455 [Gaiellaceae bacterium]|nr:hypothetical protein [Gaiellaceae bacterium]